MVIHRLGMQRHAGHEAESGHEIVEFAGAMQFPVFQFPAFQLRQLLLYLLCGQCGVTHAVYSLRTISILTGNQYIAVCFMREPATGAPRPAACVHCQGERYASN